MSAWGRTRRVMAVLAVLAALSVPGASAATSGNHVASRVRRGPTFPVLRDVRTRTPFRAGVVLVGFRPGVTRYRRLAIERRVRARSERLLGGSGRLPAAAARIRRHRGASYALRVQRGDELAAVGTLRRFRRWVRYAEPDYVMEAAGASVTLNDPGFGLEWGSLNTGQSVNGLKGTAGADDRAEEAWTVSTGSRSIVIGETDTGIEYTHPDLKANIWSNPGGVNGCAAGTHGFNELTGVCDPMDDDTSYGGHGTHVAGIMGAVGNNGIGVAGVNWNTTLLPVKWLDSNGWGDTSTLISALDWLLRAKQAGVNIRVVNDSATFPGTAYSQALSDEIDTIGAAGILFVTAAGNTGDDNDNLSVRRYPCGYDRPTEICVTATNQNDALPSWANYGSSTVDLAAPGDNIYSTLRGGGYGYISGGSMAAAQVSGTAALILSVQDFSPTALKADILNNVDRLPNLQGLVRTGGRLDVCAAVPGCANPLQPTAGTFGNTSVGGSFDEFAPDRKRVNSYPLTESGSVSKLSIYLTPGDTSGSAQIEGLIYADQGGSPGNLIATTVPLTYSTTQPAGWYDLNFSSPVTLSAGTYWIGVITGGTSHAAGFMYTPVSGARDYNTNSYASGPTNPFGAPTIDGERMSLYATYTASSSPPPPPPSPPPLPVNTSLPTISGSARSGRTLTASAGQWSNTPTSFRYQWLRCDSTGANCAGISGATSSTYTVRTTDISWRLRVTVTALNAGGVSSPATSAATSLITR